VNEFDRRRVLSDLSGQGVVYGIALLVLIFYLLIASGILQSTPPPPPRAEPQSPPLYGMPRAD